MTVQELGFFFSFIPSFKLSVDVRTHERSWTWIAWIMLLLSLFSLHVIMLSPFSLPVMASAVLLRQ